MLLRGKTREMIHDKCKLQNSFPYMLLVDIGIASKRQFQSLPARLPFQWMTGEFFTGNFFTNFSPFVLFVSVKITFR